MADVGRRFVVQGIPEVQPQEQPRNTQKRDVNRNGTGGMKLPYTYLLTAHVLITLLPISFIHNFIQSHSLPLLTSTSLSLPFVKESIILS